MKTLIVLILSLITYVTFAQHDDHDRIMALKTSYFTDKLEFTSSEAEKFWPIYNTYSNTINDLRHKDYKAIKTELSDFDNVTEERAGQLLKKFTALENKKLQLKSKLIEDLQGVISNKKTIKLFKVEDDFRRRLLKEYKARKGGNKRLPKP